NGTDYFANFANQSLYRQHLNDAPEPLTPEGVDLRYADAVVDAEHDQLIAVREDHAAGAEEAANTIVRLSLGAASPQAGDVLAAGFDFYSSPRPSPDGRQLAWLCWNHPNMPWDGTELWLADFQVDGTTENARRVAGGPEESIFQPEWSPDGRLYFVSDRSGWWNLYRLGEEGGAVAEAICPTEAEFGVPHWVFGYSTYAFASASEIVCCYIERGFSRLARLDTQTGELKPIETPYTDISFLRVTEDGRAALFRAGSPTASARVVRLDLQTGESEVLRRSSDLHIDEGYVSAAQAVEYPTEEGETAHAFYYPPRNRDFSAPEGERPPLLVKSHGGPTSMAVTALNLGIQYWTSRGFAVLDVNYGGSTGYGRAYRRRLNGSWGVVDVDDCAGGARFLAEKGLVDANRCVIDGGSAGGYTTLCALTFRDRFKAGASHYGVSDLAALVRDTHKFESRYLDRLIGPYPERADLYAERSPINYTERLSCPVIFFQGMEDKVVPPNQAEMMVEALRRKGLPVAYVAFAGEQHGFRRAENIKRALDGEIYFYARVFGFDLADEVEPVPIENLPETGKAQK
ncbi:MAG: S9 family peptidase, partial [Pyrinomonadaceae bacterium]